VSKRVTEFELIARYFTRANRSAILGNGDDCAIVAPGAGNVFAVTTDTLIEGRHFLPNLDPFKLGRRVVNVNFSDLAAMGAVPRYALLSLTLPQIDEDWISRLSVGLWSVLDAYSVELIGGNTTKGPLAIAMTAFGELPPDAALKRSGARAGDELWVSGTLGDAGWAMYALTGARFEATAEQIAKYECPEARVSLGIALRGVATSCIDISDGLLSEAKHIATASNVSIDIDIATIPTGLKHASRESTWDPARTTTPMTVDTVDAKVWPAVLDHMGQYCLLSTGDAYELLFTAPREQHDVVAAILKRENLPGACIGRVTAPDAANRVRVLDAQSRVMDIEVKGWDHFA
jgi:thiamine-monophosphate kinase